MDHIAIDLGKLKSQICRRDERGKIVDEQRVETKDLGAYLKPLAKARVILETSSESFDVADEAMALGHEVRVVPSVLAPSLGVGARQIKTDRRDAQILSKASVQLDELGSVHIPSKESRERKAICGMRDALVSARTELVNNVRGYFRTKRILLTEGSAANFAKRVRKRFESEPNGMSMAVERSLICIETLSEQIKAADKELRQIAEGDEDCTLLMTMPGVGPATSVRFAATIDDVSRFTNGHRMESYLGLTPGENSSSEKRRITSITKAGPTKVRWLLGQAAWCLWRTRPNDPLVVWANQVAKRRGKNIAVVGLARRMAGVLRAMLRDRKPYDPLRSMPAPIHLPAPVEVKRQAGKKAIVLAKAMRKPKAASKGDEMPTT